MSAQHTPGPWKAEQDGQNGQWFVEDPSGTKCQVYGEDPEETSATARLIAAAPEMLEALRGVALMLRCTLKEYDAEPWAGRVRVAIAKVEGV